MQSARTAHAVDTVLHALMTVGRSMRQRLHAGDLDPGTLWLLKTIGHRGPIRATDLATAAGLDTSTVSRHVAQLERSGMVHREPDPDDRRAQLVVLDPPGRSLLDQAVERRRELITASLADWSPTDIADFERLLTQFTQNLETTMAPAGDVAPAEQPETHQPETTQQKVSA